MCILNAINCSSHSVQDDSLFPTTSHICCTYGICSILSASTALFHPLVYINHAESFSHSCNTLTSAVFLSGERRQGFLIIYFVIPYWDLINILNFIVIATTRTQKIT